MDGGAPGGGAARAGPCSTSSWRPSWRPGRTMKQRQQWEEARVERQREAGQLPRGRQEPLPGRSPHPSCCSQAGPLPTLSSQQPRPSTRPGLSQGSPRP